jgi:hypothetical protein
VDGASSQGLFLGFLARDFGTTMTSVPRLFPQFHGSEASGQMYFTEGGSYGTRLQLCWPVDSAVVAAAPVPLRRWSTVTSESCVSAANTAYANVRRRGRRAGWLAVRRPGHIRISVRPGTMRGC